MAESPLPGNCVTRVSVLPWHLWRVRQPQRAAVSWLRFRQGLLHGFAKDFCMVSRSMSRLRGVTTFSRRTDVTCYALTIKEYLHHMLGRTDVHGLSDMCVMHAVVVPIDIDVVVGVYL